jgi:hypothetical protein
MGTPQPVPNATDITGKAMTRSEELPSPAAMNVKPSATNVAAIPPIPAPPPNPLPGQPLPPIDQPVTGTSPAPVPPADTKPKVDVTRLRVHPVQPGETYASVSKHEYNDERYARALQQYNEKEFSADKGKVPAVIRVPPAALLVERFASFIDSAAPSGIQQTGFVPK